MFLHSKLTKRIFLYSQYREYWHQEKWSQSLYERLVRTGMTLSWRSRLALFQLPPGQAPSLRLRFGLRCRLFKEVSL